MYGHACAASGTCLAHYRHQWGLDESGCLDQHRLMPCDSWGTWLVQHPHQWGLGSPRFLEQSRHMLVLLGAPVPHTIKTNESFVRTDAWSSIGSCLVLMGAPGWHNIGTSGALVRKRASSSVRSCLCCLGHLSAHQRHQRGLDASGCLDHHRLMPCVSGGTWLAQHWHHWCPGWPRCLEQYRHMLVLLGHLSPTPSTPARPLCA